MTRIKIQTKTWRSPLGIVTPTKNNILDFVYLPKTDDEFDILSLTVFSTLLPQSYHTCKV